MPVNTHYSGKAFLKFIFKPWDYLKLLILLSAIQMFMQIIVTLYCLENNDKEKCPYMLTKDINMFPKYFCSA